MLLANWKDVQFGRFETKTDIFNFCHCRFTSSL